MSCIQYTADYVMACNIMKFIANSTAIASLHFLVPTSLTVLLLELFKCFPVRANRVGVLSRDYGTCAVNDAKCNYKMGRAKKPIIGSS